MSTIAEKLLNGAIITVGAILLITLILTLPTYFLWNWLMPIIFGLKKLTLLQALGVTLLSSVLFKSASK